MKIGETKPVRPTSRVGAPTAAPRVGQTQGVGGVAPVRDTASIMGIPEAEITPKVRDAIMTLMSEVDSLRRELSAAKKRLEEVEQFADEDPLVSVLNRRAFVRELSRQISFAERYNMQASIVYFDLNDLKILNDTHGHPAGDAALQHIGNVLLKNVRDTDFVARLGGDEFGVLLANADAKSANKKAEMLARQISTSKVVWNGKPITLSAAYGVYTFQPGQDPLQAIAEADKDMYQRKRSMKEKNS